MTPKAAPRPRTPKGTRTPFAVLTGLSGAGKSQAMRALEDLGYFCVDNLPITLISTLAKLSLRAGSEIAKVAIVVDVRERTFLARFPKVLGRLRRMRRLNAALIFLEASDAALVRRFSETRRPHPLARDRSVIEGIREERARLRDIRGLADEIIDTSSLTVHELRQVFASFSRDRIARSPLVVSIVSFGFKHGIPVESDLVFDVRCLPNPHFVAALRGHSGRDRAVVRFMERHAATGEMLSRLADFLRFLIPQYVAEGKS
ncbi:MAG: RNase adapter RapZ, partial [Acidobacteria bacterium]|nr:RNase adapter RapZ [Acidobacteriota bacterium]